MVKILSKKWIPVIPLIFVCIFLIGLAGGIYMGLIENQFPELEFSILSIIILVILNIPTYLIILVAIKRIREEKDEE